MTSIPPAPPTSPVAEEHLIRVTVPLFLPSQLDYKVISAHVPSIGQWVEVMVRNKQVHGYITEILASTKFDNLKEAQLLDTTPLTEHTRSFFRWLARYTLTRPGEPLRACLVSNAIPSHRPWKEEGKAIFTPVDLNPSQHEAVNIITSSQCENKPFLLDGITGSGKTEVYFAVIANVLEKQDKTQSLVLVPEISLTPQWLERFKQRFGITPIVWHSGLTPVQRMRAWWAVMENKCPVIIGARSALFLPFQNLKCVVVDEEHEPSYKQEDQFRYNGRDAAIALAHHWHAPVILASATPSVVSWHHADTGRYTRISLPQRHGNAQLPTISLIDLTHEKLGAERFIAPALQHKIKATLTKNQQALIFLNRRGNAPLLVCGTCGDKVMCSRCSVALTVHGDKLNCHHCGYTMPYPEECITPECDTKWRKYGPGTRGVYQELEELFPHTRIALADSDAISTAKQMTALVGQLERGEIDIVVGTQMVAKGHHFPNLTLVGVIDADMGLARGDLSAAERTFQLVTQVAGRAGRGQVKGEVVLQTFSPEHALYAAIKNNDREAFYAAEIKQRQEWSDPPFSRQILLTFTGKSEADVIRTAQQAVQHAQLPKAYTVLGPAPAPIVKRRDVYRYRVMVQGPPPLQPHIKTWLEQMVIPKTVDIVVDVDPL